MTSSRCRILHASIRVKSCKNRARSGDIACGLFNQFIQPCKALHRAEMQDETDIDFAPINRPVEVVDIDLNPAIFDISKGRVVANTGGAAILTCVSVNPYQRTINAIWQQRAVR